MSLQLLTNAVKTIEHFIIQKNIKYIIIAISGGQDSILLLKILNYVKHNLPEIQKISCIHIDHQWKRNSYKQIQHLINYIKINKRNLVVYQINSITSSEKECRQQRYTLIRKHAYEYGHELIITGHNSSDKVETLLQNMNRKSGKEGLSSPVMINQIDNRIFLLRPLLQISREQIYFLCKRLNLPIWSDSTNYVYHIERNRLRYELVPYIKNFFNTSIEKNILSSTKNYYYESEYIKQNANKLYIHSKHKDKIAINYKYINKQHIILQMKTLQIFYACNLNIKIHNAVLKRIINQATKDLKKRIVAFEDKNYVHIIYKQWLYIQTKVE